MVTQHVPSVKDILLSLVVALVQVQPARFLILTKTNGQTYPKWLQNVITTVVVRSKANLYLFFAESTMKLVVILILLKNWI